MGKRGRTTVLCFAALLSASTAAAWGQATGLLGEYYNTPGAGGGPPPPPGSPAGTTFTGPPDLVRIDAVVQFDFLTGSPDPVIAVDHFMTAWRGSVITTVQGDYLFGTRADDGTRVWVNGTLVFDNWIDQGPPGTPQMGGPITLAAAATVSIRMEFYENGGGAVAGLWWQPPGAAAPVIIPTSNLRPPPPPAAPTLSGSPGYTAMGQPQGNLSWTASAGAAGYNVKKSTTPGGPYTTVSPGQAGTTYTDTAVVFGTTYYYVVSGVDLVAQEGPDSNEVSEMPVPPPPHVAHGGSNNLAHRCGCSLAGGPPFWPLLIGSSLAACLRRRSGFR